MLTYSAFTALSLIVGVARARDSAVHGARIRNSSVPLRSTVFHGGQRGDCEYCDPRVCALSADSGQSFCFVERNRRREYLADPVCALEAATIRQLVVGGDFATADGIAAACETSEADPTVEICWCRYVPKQRGLSRIERIHERNRILTQTDDDDSSMASVPTGALARGAVVERHLLSADARPAQISPLVGDMSSAHRGDTIPRRPTPEKRRTVSAAGRSNSALLAMVAMAVLAAGWW